MRELLGSAAGIIFVFGFLPYIKAIIVTRNSQEPIQPAIASWIIWTGIDAISLLAMWAKDSVNGQIIGANVGACIVLLLSLKYGKPGWEPVDKWCLVIGLAGIALWWALSSPILAMVVAQVVGFIGAVPTFNKVWREPRSEPRFSWTVFWVSCIPTLLAVPSLAPEHWIQPLGFAIGNTCMIWLLFFHRPPHKVISVPAAAIAK